MAENAAAMDVDVPADATKDSARFQVKKVQEQAGVVLTGSGTAYACGAGTSR